MGNCPSGSRFRLSPNGFGCVVGCPEDKGFQAQIVSGKPMCVYTFDSKQRVSLEMLPMLPQETKGPAKTLEQLQKDDPATYAKYKQEEDRFDKEFAVLYANIEKDVKVRDAFQGLQAAENARDQNPQAYQDARIRYYTLVKGDKWREEERERIAKAEALPKVMQYKNEATDLQTRINQQQRTVDVVNGVKNKVLSIRDELKYSVSAFGKQLDDLKSQIEIQRRMEKVKKESPYQWLDIFINLVLVLVAGGVAYVLYRKFRTPTPTPPAYTGYPYIG